MTLRWTVRAVAVLLLGALAPWSGAAGAADAAVAGLLAGPFLAVLAAGGFYARRRDWMHAGLVAGLLTVLLVGAWIGFR